MSFETAVEFILRFEGDYSNDPADAGGETKWGISKAAFPDLDIKNLTREAAISIYREKYWNRCKCSHIPSPLAIILFDSAINQGPTQAIRLFQKSLGVASDGVIGPATIAAAFQVQIHSAVPEFIARRAFRYAQHPQVVKYGLGWYRRLSAVHQLALEP